MVLPTVQERPRTVTRRRIRIFGSSIRPTPVFLTRVMPGSHWPGANTAFPDADDLLAPDMYSTLLEQAERHQLDVMQCNGERYFASEDELQPIFSRGTFTDH